MIVIPVNVWSDYKTLVAAKGLRMQYTESATTYDLHAPEGGILDWQISLLKGGSDATDFEDNYQSNANTPIQFRQIDTLFRQPEVLSRFGNLTASSTSEVLVSARAYVEQASQAQRSVVSTSANDASPSGSGAKKVKITYLDSAYALKTEEVALNGTVAVNTVATDIRFIERFEVSQGAAAAGAIKLMTTTGGGGSEFCGIGIGTYDAFLCHHYVPAGMRAWVLRWEASVDDETKFKLIGRHRPNGTDLVDTHIDLQNLMGITPPGFIKFESELLAAGMAATAYIRVNAVPNQNTSTVIRSHLYIWEEAA